MANGHRKLVRAGAGVAKRAIGRTIVGGILQAAGRTVRGAVKQAFTGSSKKRKYVTTGKLQHRPPKRFKKRIVKPINHWPKGVSRKFKTKVERALAATENWGEFRYTTQQQLRQTTNDEYSIIENDAMGKPMYINCPLQILDAYSVIYGTKASNIDYEITTDNVNANNKITVIKSYTEFFFKSTSLHVVNLEMYICTAKVTQAAVDGSERAGYKVAASYNDIATSYRDGTHLTGFYPMNANRVDSKACDWIELYRNFNVEKRVIKMLPGQSSSHFMNNSAGSWEFTSYETNNVLPKMVKGKSKMVFFRVINDVTVSTFATVGGAAVSAFASNNQGGVALRYTTTYRLMPQPGIDKTPGTGCAIACVFASYPFAGADQQVEEMNPIATTSGN